MLTQQLNYNETGLANPTHAYAYDGAGRETGDTLTCGATSPVTGTRAYDTDNHIIQQALPSLYTATNSCSVASTQQTLNYSWGADGRLANFSETQYAGGTTTAMQAAHWDGDDLLYVSYEGVAMTLYVEKLGVIWQSSNASNTWYTMVYDRDQTGTAVNEHFSVGASMGFSMLTIDNIHPFLRNCSAKTSICSVSGVPPSPSIGGPEGADPYQTPQTLLLDAAREDGYFDGTLSIQGARAYDPNMNQWTTPDAYSGEVHDPMSQHPYMWNSNNPVDYQDPTGYCSIAEPASCLAAVANAVKSVAQSPATAAVAKTIGKVAATTAGDALIVAGFVAATTAEDGDQHAESPVEGASLENVTGTGIAVYGKPGDAETAEDDFNGLKPTNVVERGSGTTTGTLANGDTVVVRDSSTKDSRPTLEVHHKGEIIVKVRYGAKPPPK
jgi:RHS repeat-associated protein